MLTLGQQDSLAKFARDIGELRKKAKVSQARVYRVPQSVGRVERGQIPLTLAWVKRFEAELGGGLVEQYRSIIDAPETRTYQPSKEDDDFAVRTTLLKSRVTVDLGETVTVRDRRVMTPLNPPLAGMRLRNRLPPVDGRRPEVLGVSAKGADVLDYFWTQDEILIVDVSFTPPIEEVEPAYQWEIVYRYDRLAHFMYEVVGARSDYFEVRVQFPSAGFEVVSSPGLPQDIAVAEARAFFAGRPTRLETTPLNRQNLAKAEYRHLRAAFLYGVFWRRTGRSASS